MKKPLILISNDDGYQAKGIHALVDFVSDIGDVIVCAPALPQSGKSRAFSLNDMTLTPVYDTPDVSLSAKHFSKASYLKGGTGIVFWYSLTGTPVDCIKVACSEICPRTPDLILGGINHGDNSSVNAHYSGTVGIVTEGTLKGIPSVAFSLCDYTSDANFLPLHDIVREVCTRVLTNGLPKGTFLNVNVPKVTDASELNGIKVCRMSRGLWLKEVETRQETADGNIIYNLRGYFHNTEPDSTDTDAWALANGYIAITPSTIDLTDYSFLKAGFMS